MATHIKVFRGNATSGEMLYNRIYPDHVKAEDANRLVKEYNHMEGIVDLFNVTRVPFSTDYSNYVLDKPRHYGTVANSPHVHIVENVLDNTAYCGSTVNTIWKSDVIYSDLCFGCDELSTIEGAKK